ncbi:MAG TPA: HEAT repeat domain-containing protein [Planctomycetota bacterium]|nr:HEAT repeat domain-containing protein [Planctomycetota bacterium]
MLSTAALFVALAAASVQNATADDKAAEDALEIFKTAIKAQGESDRIDAVKILAATVHLKTLGRLAAVVSSSDGERVRIAAIKAMALFEPFKKQVVTHLNGAFQAAAKEPRIQVAVLQALGSIGDPSALACIHHAFDDKEGTVCRAAVVAAADLKNLSSIDPLIALLTKTEKTFKANSGGAITKQMPVGGQSVNSAQSPDFMTNLKDTIDAANKSLQTITAQEITKAAEWQTWWNKNRATFKP